MTRYVGATEAARSLGVQKATLYAYVSRGLIGRRVAVDGRTSLYSMDDVDALAARARTREVAPRPSLDVQIATAVTTLDDDCVRYRGHDAAVLARTCTFEQVAELLWTGELPADRFAVSWPEPSPDDVRAARQSARLVPGYGIPAIVAVANTAGVRHPDDDPAAAARRLLAVLPSALGAPALAPGVGIADRLAATWQPGAEAVLVAAVERALILLADHELATSTLAVRLAGSVRADAYAAFVAGLAVIAGPLHGGATAAVVELLTACERHGVAAELGRRRRDGERLAGFGHKIYAGDDPRLAPLLEAVGTLPDPRGRRAIVAEAVTWAGGAMVRRPNVDLGLGALLFVAGLAPTTPLFAVARIAGFAAHLAEELTERPVRYRGIARAPQR